MSGTSGKHDPMWGMLGFLASPEDRALAALVVEVEQAKNEMADINFKELIMSFIRDLAVINGITDTENRITAKYKVHYEMIVDRIRQRRLESIAKRSAKQ